MSLNPVCSNKQENKSTKQNPQQSKLKKNCERLKILLHDSDQSKQDYVAGSNKNYPEMATCSQTKKPCSPPTKKTSIFSFEDLLKDEKWSESDFAEEEEGDLSDVVQSITGTYKKQPSSPQSQEQMKINSEKASVYPQSLTDESSEEDVPYTPLIDRVKKMQGSREGKSASAAASMKLRRLSESFANFCFGENVTSSPISDANYVVASANVPEVSFSLGITNLLESTE